MQAILDWSRSRGWLLALLLLAIPRGGRGDEIGFDRVVIDGDFPGAYQVEVADVNGDKKPDIIALGGGTCAWYENPTWKKRVITGPKQTPGVISSASTDLDGDGKSEVAIAFEFEMNEPRKGKLLLASQGATIDDPWAVRPIADIGSIHRLRWADLDPDHKGPELVVAPIFGPGSTPPNYNQESARLRLFRIDPRSGHAEDRVLAERLVLHAIDIAHRGEALSILTADNLGVAEITTRPGQDPAWKVDPLIAGELGRAPKRGCSEVHLGKWKNADSSEFLATIEPWHGDKVVVTARDRHGAYPVRTVIDDTLADGHALWVADIDGDGSDEVFAGHRGKDHRVSMYRFDGKTWNRTVIDRDIAAQDLRGGDLDGNGKPDVVSVGGATHNVVWYRPR